MPRPPQTPVRSRLALLMLVPMLVCIAAGAAFAGPAPEGGGAETEAPSARALRLLASPLQAERREAVASLVELLPEVRGQIIDLLPRASWATQMQLIEVLSRDGSPEAERALLDHLMRTDETQAVRIRMNLARDEAASARLLQRFREDPRAFLAIGSTDTKDTAPGAQGLRRLMDLLSLLQRAEIEEKFLSRKSKSGSTGYYRGQYDLLKDPALGETFRLQSLDVVTGIALNEAVVVPGVYRSGAYRFLRPHYLDEVELVGMALNAVAELCTPDDLHIIRRLHRHLLALDTKRMLLYNRLDDVLMEAGWGKAFDDAHQAWEDALGEYADVLSSLAIIVPDLFDRTVSRFIREIRSYEVPKQPRAPLGMIAALLIRVGRYPEAIDAYETYLARGYGSAVLSHYNLACAWASYSQAEGASALEVQDRKQRALRELSLSVEAGWSDVGWMNEDRDLDAIRDTQTYRDLVTFIEEKFKMPEEEPLPGAGDK